MKRKRWKRRVFVFDVGAENCSIMRRGCQDMRWEAGSWRQDITYEKETNVGKGCCCCCCGYTS